MAKNARCRRWRSSCSESQRWRSRQGWPATSRGGSPGSSSTRMNCASTRGRSSVARCASRSTRCRPSTWCSPSPPASSGWQSCRSTSAPRSAPSCATSLWGGPTPCATTCWPAPVATRPRRQRLPVRSPCSPTCTRQTRCWCRCRHRRWCWRLSHPTSSGSLCSVACCSSVSASRSDSGGCCSPPASRPSAACSGS